MKSSRWPAFALLLGVMAFMAPAVMAEWLVFNGSPRSVNFQRVIDAAAMRGDKAGAEHLQRLADAPPAIPPAWSPSMNIRFPSYGAKYDALQSRMQNAMNARDYASVDQWRVDQAEADLALVAWELRKGSRASTTFMEKYLADAAWALNCHIGLNTSVSVPAPQAAAASPTARPAAQISAAPAQVVSGAMTRVSWSTENATSAQINGRSVLLNGSESVEINEASKFVIVAVGEGGEATDIARVSVLNLPTAALRLDQHSIERGECATLTWQSTNADQVSLNGEMVALNGSREVCPEESEIFRLVAIGPGGRADDQERLDVTRAAAKLFRIQFDFDEWAIRADAMDTMNQVAALMRQNVDVRMSVDGHTDGKGTEEYNIALGERRAQSVRDYFLAHYGLDPSRFGLDSRGEAEPIAPNTTPSGEDDPDGRSLNRRAEFTEIRFGQFAKAGE